MTAKQAALQPPFRGLLERIGRSGNREGSTRIVGGLWAMVAVVSFAQTGLRFAEHAHPFLIWMSIVTGVLDLIAAFVWFRGDAIRRSFAKSRT